MVIGFRGPWIWGGLLALGLSACGGGGSGSGTEPASAPAATPSSPGASAVATSVDIVTTAPTSPTGYNQEELAAYNRFSNHRAQCGFGYLSQSTALDLSATNHVQWMVANNTVSHSEIPGTTGYTGSISQARMIAAGYMEGTQYGEVLAGGVSVAKTGFGLVGARALGNPPNFH